MTRKPKTKKKLAAAIEYRTPFSSGSDIAKWEYLHPQEVVASPSPRTLPDDTAFSPDKAKKWINTQKELAIMERKRIRQKVKGAIANHASHEAYIKNLQRYLRTGDWVDDFYGEHQQEKVRYKCIALAYDADGLPKRNIGTFYPDLGCVYTKDMSDMDREEL